MNISNNCQAAPATKQVWQTFPLQRTPDESVQMGELVFLPGGAVVIANTAHADGEPINQTFGHWTALRDAGFKQMLIITDPNGDAFRFCYSDNSWRRIVPYSTPPNQSLGHAMKRDIAHQGLVVAIVCWTIKLCMNVVIGGFTIALIFEMVLLPFWLLFKLFEWWIS